MSSKMKSELEALKHKFELLEKENEELRAKKERKKQKKSYPFTCKIILHYQKNITATSLDEAREIATKIKWNDIINDKEWKKQNHKTEFYKKKNDKVIPVQENNKEPTFN